jgi:hypothetical protein
MSRFCPSYIISWTDLSHPSNNSSSFTSKSLIYLIIIFNQSAQFEIEWVAILVRILEVMGSNLGPGTNWGSLWFLVDPPWERWNSAKLCHDRFLKHIFQRLLHWWRYISTLYSLRYWQRLEINHKQKPYCSVYCHCYAMTERWENIQGCFWETAL